MTSGRRPWYNAETGESIRPIVIAICGGTASGKTLLARKIASHLNGDRKMPLVADVCMDSFYRELNPEELELAFANKWDFDHPSAFDWDLLVKTIDQVRNGMVVDVPVYDFATHSRSATEKREVYGCDVVLVEGILILHDERIREMCDLTVFVEEEADVRICRRINRDTTVRGRTVASVLEQYIRTVKPSHDEFTEPSKKYADLIVPRGRFDFNPVAADVICSFVAAKMTERWSQWREAHAQSAAVLSTLSTPEIYAAKSFEAVIARLGTETCVIKTDFNGLVLEQVEVDRSMKNAVVDARGVFGDTECEHAIMSVRAAMDHGFDKVAVVIEGPEVDLVCLRRLSTLLPNAMIYKVSL